MESGGSSAPTAGHVPSGVSLVRVMSGGSTVYGIDSSGAVWSWGQNNNGQLGFGAVPPSARPTKVGLSLSCVSSTAANVVGLTGSVSNPSSSSRRTRSSRPLCTRPELRASRGKLAAALESEDGLGRMVSR